MKNDLLKKIIGFTLSVLALVFGATGNVIMSAATSLPDAGVSNSGAEGGVDTAGASGNASAADGIATETQGREDGDAEFYLKDIDERITKIRPMATPIDQISRYAEARPSDSFEVKYYSVGTRPIKTTLEEAITASATATSVKLEVADSNMFTLDDTIRVVGVKAVTNYKGSAYNANADNTPDLELCVCGKAEDGMPIVYAVNGNLIDGQAIGVPNIAANTVLIRMGKSGGELDAQTGRFNNLPTSELQYCQNFMMQIEQSTFDKIAAKEVNWNFSDQEEDGIYDMRLGMENTFMFGDMNKIVHTTKDGMAQWFTRGIWWMAGKDIEVGHIETVDNESVVVISDDDLVDISKDLFVGTGIGNKRKVLIAGSDFVAAMSKIQSEKFRLKDTVEVWNLKFKSWETDFGEILLLHSELFDLNDMADCAFALDPEFLTKKTHVSWSRSVLDLKTAGIRNTNAVVLQEVSCLYLRYAKAHARMKLAAA